MDVHVVWLLLSSCVLCMAWGSNDRVKLKHIEVLTLHDGRMTTGRRSSPVPQLKCIGGTAGCNSFRPKVVQCYNRGSDGVDIQWECKAEMSKAYQFGTIEVICEGYDYPDDPYILKGSCGLEYSLELAKDGDHSNNYKPNNYYKTKASSGGSDIIVLIVIGVIIYALYKTCLSNTFTNSEDDSSDPGPYPQRPSWFGSWFRGNNYGGYGGPPPPGFRSDYMPNDSCGRQSSGSSTGGGFWTGAATGGILGYMLGNRNTRSGHSYPSSYSDYHAFGGTGSSSTTSDYSSETRTTSGFGGTSRR